MRSIILRSLCITAVTFLIVQESHAQRRGHYRHYGHGPYRGQRVVHISGPRVILPYRGVSFHYSNGYYYRPYGSYFRVVAPPAGIHINILPRGYRRIYVQDVPYYYYGGTYYRPGNKSDQYEVVEAPLGAAVPELPNGAKVVVINDQKYFELDGTYYKEEIRGNDEIWYTVVGKNGRLDTDDEEFTEDGPYVGDIVDELPANCKKVVLNGNKYFVSPDDVYYEETVSGNEMRYKIVGK